MEIVHYRIVMIGNTYIYIYKSIIMGTFRIRFDVRLGKERFDYFNLN